MQASITQFQCGQCHYHCPMGTVDASPFSDYYSGINIFANIMCPACKTNLFQCRRCHYNNPKKYNIKRHYNRVHCPATHDAAAESVEDDNNDVAISVDFNSERMDFSEEAGSTADNDDDDDDVMQIDDDGELDELPPYHEGADDKDVANQALPYTVEEYRHEEFLCDLVADECDDDELTPLHYSQINPLRLQPLGAFEMFHDIKSRVYYWQNDVHRRLSNGKNLLGGIMNIAWCAIRQLCSYSREDVIPLDDTILMFNMLDHALANKGEQQQNFFHIISNIFNRIPTTIASFVKSMDNDAQQKIVSFHDSLDSHQRHAFNEICNLGGKPTNVKIPKDKNEANALLLKGQYSMFSRIPAPKVHTDVEGHAYVNISDVIDHAMADGLPILFLQDHHGNKNNDSINGCQASAELLQTLRSQVNDPNNTAFGAIVIWSDGFCRTYVKQKDNSVWIMTITFLNTDNKTKSPMHTYCVAMGKSSANHTPVFEIMMKQLEEIQRERRRYCGISGEWMKTSFGVLAYSTDRIERCFLLNTSQLGNFGQRSHWACAIDPKTLPMCKTCFNRLVGTLRNSKFPLLDVFNDTGNTCQDCCRWDCDNAVGPLDDKYPRLSGNSADCPTPPDNRTVDENYHLPMRQTFSWLKQGLVYSFYNSTIMGATQWKKFHITAYLKSMGMNNRVIECLWTAVKQKRRNPTSEPIPFVPFLWTIEHILPMAKFINSPMHLIFHGVVDDVMALVHKFMSSLDKLTTFEKFVNKYMLEIESFRLGWCKLRKLPKAFWLAEDILGFSRIMPCIYGLFFANNFKFGRHTDNFLCCHLSIKRLLNSLHVLVSALMNPKTSRDVRKIEAYIKVFLSCGHFASECINGNGAAFWMDRGNELSLLNLPAQIEKYGPVRDWWEGVMEAYIQEIKPQLIASMRKTATYFRDKLKLIYKLKAMEFIKKRMKDMMEDDDEEEERDLPYRSSKNFYSYSTIDEVKQQFERGMPISAFVYDDNYVFVAFGKSKKNIQIAPINYVMTADCVELCGIPFANCSLRSEMTYMLPLGEMKKKVTSHCILLPYIADCANRTQSFEQKFAFIHDDWDILTGTGVKDEALLSKKLFY